MTQYRITINGQNKAAMVDLAGKHNIEVFDHGIRFAPDIGYTVTASATPQVIQKLRQSGYHVVQHEEVVSSGKLHGLRHVTFDRTLGKTEQEGFGLGERRSVPPSRTVTIWPSTATFETSFGRLPPPSSGRPERTP
jgi:hypothetical protein